MANIFYAAFEISYSVIERDIKSKQNKYMDAVEQEYRKYEKEIVQSIERGNNNYL